MKYYMQQQSSDIATEEEWRDDFENMDIESWSGMEAEDANPKNWIEEGHLIEVLQDENREWEEV